MSTKAFIVLALAKKVSGMTASLKINTICNFQAMESTVELNRLLLKFLLLC